MKCPSGLFCCEHFKIMLLYSFHHLLYIGAYRVLELFELEFLFMIEINGTGHLYVQVH